MIAIHVEAAGTSSEESKGLSEVPIVCPLVHVPVGQRTSVRTRSVRRRAVQLQDHDIAKAHAKIQVRRRHRALAAEYLAQNMPALIVTLKI